MRLFIAIDIPENIKELLHGNAKQIYENNYFTGKITKKENMHLTLKFLGEVDENNVEKIIERLENISFRKFKAMLGGYGVFNEEFIKIIWGKIIGADELQSQVDEALSSIFPKEERFHGHVTLARVKNVKEKRTLLDIIKNIKPENFEFEVDKFYLIQSELQTKGIKYTILKEFNLL